MALTFRPAKTTRSGGVVTDNWSAVSDNVREPVNRHTTIRLAKPSTALPSAQPIREMEPATNPCHRHTAPSTHIHSRLAHASQRAQRAARSQSASRSTRSTLDKVQTHGEGVRLASIRHGSIMRRICLSGAGRAAPSRSHQRTPRNDGTVVDRAALATDLERVRADFHDVLDLAGEDEWDKPTAGTRWTNEELLFHMVFGYMVVQRLLRLVRLFGRLPGGSAVGTRRYSTRLHHPST
jgi:hypothetical protein